MRYVVMAEISIAGVDDYTTEEYTGIYHDSKKMALEELKRARKDQFCLDAYIKEAE